ncbi:MAG: hypothetical protein Kow00124_02690 [Anaerolineae bacterium]
MNSSRIFRTIEGSLVILFFIQAARVVFATLLRMSLSALAAGRVDGPVIAAHLLLLAGVLVTWLAPRQRRRLPETLSIAAIVVALARVGLAFQPQVVRLYAGILLIAAAAVYMLSLIRAGWRTWVVAFIAGLLVDQLFRAYDTYDISLRAWHLVSVGELLYRVPWVAVQAVLSALLIVISRLARRGALREPYEPAVLDGWGGLAVGGFLALETVLLAMPNVVARWAGVPYEGVVPWLLLATALALLPVNRGAVGHLLALFDERLRGLVWALLFILLIVVGNRFGGTASVCFLAIAQTMAVLLLWWVPRPASPGQPDLSGPWLSLGMLACTVLIYLYSMAFEYTLAFPGLEGQALTAVLLASVLLCLPRLMWRGEDPWMLPPIGAARGLPLAVLVLVTVAGLLLSGVGTTPTLAPRDTLRVATYNINGGYDVSGVYRLDLTALTIEASAADVIVLQEVDTGRPLSYGVDQVQFLARRLGMYQVYQPTVEYVHGIAILSRWPVVEGQGTPLPSGGARGAVRGVLADPESGRRVALAGAQLTPGPVDQRLQQLAVLVDLLGEASPAVLAADLGADPTDVIYQQLVGSGFVDPDAVLGIERGFTTPAVNPTVRHDYVLARGLVPVDARQVDSLASDHRLVVVELAWPDDFSGGPG